MKEKAAIYFNSLEVDNGNVSDTRFSDYDVFIAYEKGALDFAKPREKRITELEKENAKLKLQMARIIRQDPSLLNEELLINENYRNEVANLKKENAELKEQNQKLLGSCEGATMLYEHLTKAIKIIKALLRLWNDVMTEETVKALVAQAEQFLKDVDK